MPKLQLLERVLRLLNYRGQMIEVGTLRSLLSLGYVLQFLRIPLEASHLDESRPEVNEVHLYFILKILGSYGLILSKLGLLTKGLLRLHTGGRGLDLVLLGRIVIRPTHIE